MVLTGAFWDACASAGEVMQSEPVAALAPNAYFGRHVDATSGADVCVVASLDRCLSQAGQSREPGGLLYPYGVAVDPRTGDLEVAEVEGGRVQRFTAQGASVSTITDKLASPASVAVDPTTGDVYVLQIRLTDMRVDKFSSDGRFLWRIGGTVNRTTGADLCAAWEVRRSAVRCGRGMPDPISADRPGWFKFAAQSGDLIAVDGKRRLLYVGDEHRIQKFDTNGRWRGELQLASLSAERSSSVVALVLDPSGDLFVVYRAGPVERYTPSEQAGVIREFSPSGRELGVHVLHGRQAATILSIDGIAIDRHDRLAAMGVEVGGLPPGRFAALYEAVSGRLISYLPAPLDNDGIAFGANGDLYVATAVGQDVAVYAPAMAPERPFGSLKACIETPLAGSPCAEDALTNCFCEY